MASFLAAAADPTRPVRLVRAGDGTVVAQRVEPAFDSATRRRGLLGRDALDPQTAIAIVPTNAVHTFFMRFAIDMLFVARDGRIVKICRRVRPWRMAVAWSAHAVIELAADAPGTRTLAPGDRLEVAPAVVGRAPDPDPSALSNVGRKSV